LLKLLILAGILYAIYVFLFKKQNILKNKKTVDEPREEKQSETMVECAKCSTFISVNEAYISSGKYFCSKECADAYTRS